MDPLILLEGLKGQLEGVVLVGRERKPSRRAWGRLWGEMKESDQETGLTMVAGRDIYECRVSIPTRIRAPGRLYTIG